MYYNNFIFTFLVLCSILIDNSITSNQHNDYTISVSNSDDYNEEELYDTSDNSDDNTIDRYFYEFIRLHESGRNITISRHVKHINETFERFNRLMDLAKNFINIDKNMQRNILKMTEFFYSLNINFTDQCFQSIVKVFNSMRNTELWAFKFIDSVGKIPSEIADGLTSSFGEYDECLDISSGQIRKDDVIIRGKYCLMKVIIPFPKQNSNNTDNTIETLMFDYKSMLNNIPHEFRKYTSILPLIKNPTSKAIHILNLIEGETLPIGICIPSQCSALEIENAINKVIFPITRIPLAVGPNCEVRDEILTLDNDQRFALWFLSIMAILTIFSTIFDILCKTHNILSEANNNNPYTDNRSHKLKKLLTSFSVKANYALLVNVDNKFAAINTIKLAIVVNIYLMLFYYGAMFGVMHLKSIATSVPSKFLDSNKYILLRNLQAYEPVFMISAILSSYYLLTYMRENPGKLSYFGQIFRIWFKYASILFGTILLIYLLPLTGDGPIWKSLIGKYFGRCKHHKSLLYTFSFTANLIGVVEGLELTHCNVITWCFSAFFQLQLISTKVAMLYNKRPKLAILITISLIAFGLISKLFPLIFYGIKPFILIKFSHEIEEIIDSAIWYHTSSHLYLTSYFVGVIIAFIIIDNKRTQISGIIETFLWIVSIVLIITTLFWEDMFTKLDITDTETDLVHYMLFFTIGRFGHTIGFAWILYALSTGRGGLINRCLSWSGFQPFARLSLIIYTLYEVMISHRVASIKEVYVLTDYWIIQNALFDFAYLSILSAILYFLIACPAKNIGHLIFFNHIISVTNEEKVSINSKQSNDKSYLDNNN